MSGQFSISTILERIGHADRDIRHQGLLDLQNQLKSEGFRIGEWESRIVQVILDKLKDQGTIQNLATQCLAALLPHLHEAQLQRCSTALMDLLLSQKQEERSMASSTLKSLILEAPYSSAPTLCRCTVPRLITGIRQDDTKLDSLDTLVDIIKRFGSFLADDYQTIQETLLAQLTSGRNIIRKRSLTAIAFLAIHVPEQLFDSLLNDFIGKVETSRRASERQIAINAIGGISRSVGHRFGKHLDRLIPLLIRIARDCTGEEAHDDELRESCIDACTSFVHWCSAQVAPHVEPIIDLCMHYLGYDPNYATDEDEEEMDDDEDDEDDAEYSDDEDMSWKVRRACAKCLAMVIKYRPEHLPRIYAEVAPRLIQRFREREDHVRADLFDTFVELLHHTRRTHRALLAGQESPLALLVPHVNLVMQRLLPLLRKRTGATQQGVLVVLKELLECLDGGLAAHLDTILPRLAGLFTERGTQSPLKVLLLEDLDLLLALHPADAIAPQLAEITPMLVQAVGDGYFKTSTQALKCTETLIRKMNTHPGKLGPHLDGLFQAVSARLKAADQEQEVKLAAIAAIATLLAEMGDSLGAHAAECLQILLDRTQNEITRQAAVSALSRCADSPLGLPLAPLLSALLPQLASFLRKNNRSLVQQSLLCLNTLARKQTLPAPQLASIITEAAPLVSERDLPLAHRALQLCETLLTVSSATVRPVCEHVLPNAMTLVQSTLLQGQALDALLAFFSALVRVGGDFQKRLDSILALVTEQTPKHAYSSISRAAASLCIAAGDQSHATVQRFLRDLRQARSQHSQLLALLCLGDMGREIDLSQLSGLEDTILGKFDDASEELQMAASFSLGNIAIGALARWVPRILELINTRANWQYLLINALKEIIVRMWRVESRRVALEPFAAPIAELLMNCMERGEEGLQTIIAECLGRLGLVKPDLIVPLMEQNMSHANEVVRAGIAASIRFAIVEKDQPIDHMLHERMGTFLRLLQDPSLSARRSFLLTLKNIVHLKVVLVLDHIQDIIPVILHETVINEALRRKVEVGPFKQLVDDGLPLRKAAYETLQMVQLHLFNRMDPHAFVHHLVSGLGDEFEIRLASHDMLGRTAERDGGVVTALLDELLPPLQATLTFRCKPNAVKQDVQRNEEQIRSALRAVHSIAGIPRIDTVASWGEFMTKVVNAGDLREKYATVCEERKAAQGRQ